jgi:hypothetical protein
MGFEVKGAAMNFHRFMMSCLLSLLVSNWALGQECQSLHNALPSDLMSFISGTVPNQGNAECVAWALKALGAQKYEPAIPLLAKFLDFKRPPNDDEKNGILLHAPSIWSLYPAAGALDQFGEKALPELVSVIKSESTSNVARENAVAVLMMGTYKYHRANGVALLKHEEANTNDDSSKKRLRAAISTAVAKWCIGSEQAECKDAANKEVQN